MKRNIILLLFLIVAFAILRLPVVRADGQCSSNGDCFPAAQDACYEAYGAQAIDECCCGGPWGNFCNWYCDGGPNLCSSNWCPPLAQ